MDDGARTAVIVDDDPDVRLILKVALEAIGFVVHEADTGHGGVELVRMHEPDLVTLDLVLPGFGGVEVCRRIRGITDAYIIMISASTDETDRLVGLAVGADDYVPKPFSPREVQARVSAMFRRPRSTFRRPLVSSADPTGVGPTGVGPIAWGPIGVGSTSTGSIEEGSIGAGSFGAGSSGQGGSFALIAPALPAPPQGLEPAPAPLPDHYRPDLGVPASVPTPRAPIVDEPEAETGVLRHGQLMIDSEARVAWCGTVELPLTKIEFDLLATMMGNPRRVWRRETLLNIVWGGTWSDYHVVEVHIGNLRRKLSDAAGAGALLIKTVRGIGYRMAPVEP